MLNRGIDRGTPRSPKASCTREKHIKTLKLFFILPHCAGRSSATLFTCHQRQTKLWRSLCSSRTSRTATSAGSPLLGPPARPRATTCSARCVALKRRPEDDNRRVLSPSRPCQCNVDIFPPVNYLRRGPTPLILRATA